MLVSESFRCDSWTFQEQITGPFPGFQKFQWVVKWVQIYYKGFKLFEMHSKGFQRDSENSPEASLKPLRSDPNAPWSAPEIRFHWNAMESPETPWDLLNHPETLDNSWKHSEFPYDPMKLLNSLKCFYIPYPLNAPKTLQDLQLETFWGSLKRT